MEKKVTFTDALLKYNIPQEDAVEIIKSAGLTPSSVIASTQFQNYVGRVTPDKSTNYAEVEFNYEELRSKFANYCKDYKVRLESNTPSKALEFCSKMLFEVGPNWRKENKSKGDKMIQFNFCYEKTTDNQRSFDVKTIFVSTFKEKPYMKNLDDDKLILTFKQAGLLATDIFIDAIRYAYTTTQPKILCLTPLCAAIFSRASIGPMSEQLKMTETEVTVIITASTCSGGQYLDESDMACAIVATICAIKRMTNPGAKEQIIKVVKQYAARKKQYLTERFNIFRKYALGGLPPGMDANTLIEIFNNLQAVKKLRLHRRV